MCQKEKLSKEEFKEIISVDVKPRYVDLNMLRAINQKLSKKQRKEFQKLGNFKSLLPSPKDMLGEKDLDNNLSEQEWEWLKKEYLAQPVVVLVGTGHIDFSYQTYVRILFVYIQKQLKGQPASDEKAVTEAMKRFFTYEEYLNIYRDSIGKIRQSFSTLYHECGSYVICYGKVQKKNVSKRLVCFDRIYIYNPIELDATYSNYQGIEDHVWVEFETEERVKELNVGDKVSFSASIYPYLKVGKGKQIDFGLFADSDKDGYFEIVNDYNRPTEEEQRKHSIQHLICAELCLFNNHCYGHCIANEEWLQEQRMILGYYSKEPCNS